MAGIYIHIPFCKRKCVYCDFYSTAQFDKYSAGYLEAALQEIKGQSGFLNGEPVHTLYFGGGTPSLYSPGDIGRMVTAVKENFDTSTLEEITLEANPEDLLPDYLAGIYNAGINRLSIGIQSFDDERLRFMRRRHDAARAITSVEDARRAGFDNTSIDLIYGLPGMSHDDWAATIRKATELHPQHISAYHLTVEPGTTLGRMAQKGTISEIPDEESQRQFLTLNKILTAAGYEHYEVSNFALPGYRSRHNSSYWCGIPYLGIGPGAHSFEGGTRRWCGQSVKEYIAGPQYTSETLSPVDRYNETVMTRLRTADGLPVKEIPDYREQFLSLAAPLFKRRILKQDGDRYYISPQDFLTSDAVIAALFI